MRKVILWTVAAAFLLGVFGTAILSHIQLLPALPDLILILVVYIALYNGTAAGITAGFFSGLIFDFLSISATGIRRIFARRAITVENAFFGISPGVTDTAKVLVLSTSGTFALRSKISPRCAEIRSERWDIV